MHSPPGIFPEVTLPTGTGNRLRVEGGYSCYKSREYREGDPAYIPLLDEVQDTWG